MTNKQAASLLPLFSRLDSMTLHGTYFVWTVLLLARDSV